MLKDDAVTRKQVIYASHVNMFGLNLCIGNRNQKEIFFTTCREQQLLSVFEAVISTLEGKLQRIDNLDKAVEHMMRRVESLDNKIADNILKTDAIISRLGDLNTKLESDDPLMRDKISSRSTSSALNTKLSSLDQKVSDIDTKLVNLKNQIDSNFLPVDDINAEASEKKPIHMNVAAEITRAMNNEVMSHVTKDLDQLRKTTEAIDKKLQFHVNLVSQNVGKMLGLVQDVHEAVVEQNSNFAHNATTTVPPFLKSSKIDSLVHQVKPILTVSEKMDEVWNVVVGTKSSVDDLLPKSDKLLTQTQRQERAIGQIHQDLRTKTNLIIENLDMVEKRLKKQEDDVTILSQRPVPADLLIDPTIDRLVEYNPNRYSIIEEPTEPSTSTTTPSSTTQSSSSSSPSTSAPQTVSSTPQGNINTIVNASPANQTTGSPIKTLSRKGGIIFPSVKNKPSKINTTFVSESVGIKDIKVSKQRKVLLSDVCSAQEITTERYFTSRSVCWFRLKTFINISSFSINYRAFRVSS